MKFPVNSELSHLKNKLFLSNFDNFLENANDFIYISFFDHWLSREEIESDKMATYFLSENADKKFYKLFYNFEQKIIDFLFGIYDKGHVFGFFPNNSKKDSPLFILETKGDLEVLATVSLRTEKEVCFYSVFYEALIYTNEDLTWKIIFLNPKLRKLLESNINKTKFNTLILNRGHL
ncbi:hypothetical protein MS2017_1905 [Bathymodiolus thermophilus thioautotrophic gill symbiont]|uniref:Uncharacterized protein n=1 Tax=Bathymodiolus thermophilus thioautotrophic gill symbiont TaxID=2360 RepID=A0A3G3IP52_9GAMM|nr:hypothetical protein [Bathymodiolus thermophilus thioautotrophic gill symbiont]AYQ57570.1 hypothetical protein MS2017_1905 [Bathymodiolus thermophilus thioautotrophic gill symbiont]